MKGEEDEESAKIERIASESEDTPVALKLHTPIPTRSRRTPMGGQKEEREENF